MVGSASLPMALKSYVTSTDIQSIKLSRVVHFTPSASAPTGSAVTLSTTVRKKRNTPTHGPPPRLLPLPQTFLTSLLPPLAHTDLLSSDRVSALLGFPPLLNKPFSLSSLVLLLLPLPPLLLLLQRLLFPVLMLLTFSPMPSWRWTLPSRPLLPTSTSPQSARLLQVIPALHSCLPLILAFLHVRCLQPTLLL